MSDIRYFDQNARRSRAVVHAGADKSEPPSAAIWLTSMADFAGMHAEHDAWIVPERRPARCC